MNQLIPPTGPQDPDEVARRQARYEQMAMESKLDIMRLSRQQRESAVRRRSSFIVVFALAGLVAWYLDHKGYPPEKSIAGCVVTIVVVGALWAYRKA